ncbi:DsbA family protein [Nonlabens xiamenensis]|uniref:hypothetical protein n=1 Tax=Nonlabens xiamenensis TaxID=2341043 RepID=UPI000F60EB2E|nr:hypothetical protein [Nonlabens xiamenensis]
MEQVISDLDHIHMHLSPRFLVEAHDKESKAYIISASILALPLEIQNEALTDWFQNKNYKVWTKKWQRSFDKTVIHKQLIEHRNWCFSQQINYTPALIINNKLVTSSYTKDQIKDIIIELNNKLMQPMEKAV